MAKPRRSVPLSGLRHAFDEARFGAARTLNLRESHPTAAEAVARAEAWLRQQQVQPPARPAAHEALIITGRGNQSPGGVSVVRASIVQLLDGLKRRGVLKDYQEHTPGSFVVQLAPMHRLWETPASQPDDSVRPLPGDPSTLQGLDRETRTLLRDLAERSLDALGVRDRAAFLESEMLRQFSAIAASVAAGPAREERLRAAIRLAAEQLE
ncbi:MAG TPA: hypothetical protein VJU87_00970 [Gemmatimonadaceae bacterium]|nr:hypothetical protein [Gemmatimonadaceae bacterium]